MKNQTGPAPKEYTYQGATYHIVKQEPMKLGVGEKLTYQAVGAFEGAELRTGPYMREQSAVRQMERLISKAIQAKAAADFERAKLAAWNRGAPKVFSGCDE